MTTPNSGQNSGGGAGAAAGAGASGAAGAAAGAGAAGVLDTGAQNAGAAAGAAAAAAAAGGGNTPVEFPEWGKALTDDLKVEPSLKLFTDVNGLAKSYVHLAKQMGKDKIVLPDPKTATDADYREIFQKLGLPEAVDKYDVKVAEGKKVDDAILKGFKENAHKAGILPKQAQAMLDWYASATGTMAEEMKNAQIAQTAKALDDYKASKGTAWDGTVTAAKVAVEEFGGEKLRAHLKAKGLSNDPVFIEMFATIAKSLKEDKIPRPEGGAGGFGQSVEEIQAEISKLERDLNGPLYRKDHPDHKVATAQRTRLYEAMHGTG